MFTKDEAKILMAGIKALHRERCRSNIADNLLKSDIAKKVENLVKEEEIPQESETFVATPPIEEIREQYELVTGKSVPPKFRHNKAWLLSKING
jgi:negative regulator of sigma E activity